MNSRIDRNRLLSHANTPGKAIVPVHTNCSGSIAAMYLESHWPPYADDTVVTSVFKMPIELCSLKSPINGPPLPQISCWQIKNVAV